jgi:hypothetical protein
MNTIDSFLNVVVVTDLTPATEYCCRAKILLDCANNHKQIVAMHTALPIIKQAIHIAIVYF